MAWSVRSILTADAAKIWHIVAPLLAPAVALTEGRYDMQAVFNQVREQRSLLWVVYDDDLVIKAAFIAAKRRYPCADWLAVEFMGGDGMNDWIETVVETLASFARESDLVGLEMAGRKGWTRVLAASGWRENAVLLIKPLDAAPEIAGD